MATRQNDAAAMTQEQLAEVSGGPHIRNYGVTAPIQQRRANGTAFKIILPADPPVRENTFRTTNMLHDTAMA